MREWDASRVAHAAGARLIAEPSPASDAATGPGPGPRAASIDSRAGVRGETTARLLRSAGPSTAPPEIN